jgi:hypothetical protein
MSSPIKKAVASGNGNRLFTEKRHAQIANNPRSPHCQIEAEILAPFQPRYLIHVQGTRFILILVDFNVQGSRTAKWMHIRIHATGLYPAIL